jgi:hypothetical protein
MSSADAAYLSSLLPGSNRSASSAALWQIDGPVKYQSKSLDNNP